MNEISLNDKGGLWLNSSCIDHVRKHSEDALRS